MAKKTPKPKGTILRDGRLIYHAAESSTVVAVILCPAQQTCEYTGNGGPYDDVDLGTITYTDQAGR